MTKYIVVGLMILAMLLLAMIALHWATTAFSTYVLHTMHGNGYAWWSGPGANFGEATIIGVAIGAFRRWNCESPWCFRHGMHPTADGLNHLLSDASPRSTGP